MPQQNSPFVSVLRREWGRMTSRRLYFGACVVLPLFCIFFMATIFGSGQMERIPIGIVDLDWSATSRDISRTVETVPTFAVTAHFSDQESARKATQQKKIYGYLVIPPNFESDVLAGRQATLSYYYHYALLSVGSEVRGAFETVLQPLSMGPIVSEATALGVSESTVTNFLVPVNVQSHPLYNPDLDYSVYLSHPYTVIFIVMAIFANYVMFGVLHIPFSCGFWPLNLTAVLFVIATQALGVFIFSIFPAISIIISIASMVGSLGATLSGVTFPAPFMFPAVYYASFLFPVRHFVEINQNLLYGDYGFAYTWQNVAALFLFIPAALLLLPRLKRAVLSHRYENID